MQGRVLSLFIVVGVFLSSSSAGLAQGRQDPMPPGIEDLPIGLSPRERARLGEIGAFKSLTAPPLAPVRASAEWDENVGVFCLWDNASLMNELQKTNDVYVITQNQSWWVSWLTSNGIPTTNFHYLNAPTNTWWVRDYGPWFVWDGNHDFGLVDNIYNRPRPLDDVIPGAIAAAYGIPYYGMDLIHTGGNYYTDGYGNAWSSRLVYQENPTKTKAQVDQLMADYLGIWRYVTAELNYDIEHFDTFGKLLAPDTLLWGSFPVDTTPWAWSEGALKAFQKLQSPYGWPYKVHRMPLFSTGGSWTAYINSLQTMQKIVIPSYNATNDAQATAIYQAAAPGYQVAKVANGGTTWGDSVHCRTRNFIRGDALRIYPKPHWETADDQANPYVVRAEVMPAPPAVVVGNPTIHYSVTGGPPFSAVPMFATGNPFEYAGSIPAWSHGTQISYYIEAQDSAGNVKTAPLVAPAGLFTIRVEPDTQPPSISHVVLSSLEPSAWPPEIVCTALDDGGIPTLTLEYRIDGVPQPTLAMTQDAGTFVFRATLSGSAALGDVISYRILASDPASKPNTSASPWQGWHWFRIQNSESVLVVDLDQTPNSGEKLAEWCGDFGLEVAYSSTWPTDLTGVGSLLICLGMNPTQASLSTAQANTLVSFLNAGGAAYLEGGDAWASASSASIYRAFFGVSAASAGATLNGPLVGVPGEISEGMSFAYGGERNSSDHLTLAAGAHALLLEGAQVKAASYATGTYQTVAASFQIDGLQDGAAPSRAKYLAGSMLDHLGLGIDLVAYVDPANPAAITLDFQATPGKPCAVFAAPAPGYQDLGAPGVLRLDRTKMKIVHSQVAPASGRIRVQLSNDPVLPGTERYYQAYSRDFAPATYHLTNRDRVWIGLP